MGADFEKNKGKKKKPLEIITGGVNPNDADNGTQLSTLA